MSDYLGHPQQALWDLIHDIRHAMLTTTRGELEVRIDRAEYWDLKSSKMVQLLRIAKAAVTGQSRAHAGEHREVSFH